MKKLRFLILRGVFNPKFHLIMPYSKASSLSVILRTISKVLTVACKACKIRLPTAPPTSSSLTSLTFMQAYWLPSWSLSRAKDIPAIGPLPLFSHPPGTLSRYSYALHSHFILVSYLIAPFLRCLLLLYLYHLSSFFIPFLYFVFLHSRWPYISTYLCICFLECNDYESVSVLFATAFPMPRTVLNTNRYSDIC